MSTAAALPADVPPLEVQTAPEPPSTRLRPVWLDQTAEEIEADYFDDLCDGLDEMTVAMLREIAGNRGWTLRGTQKAGLVEQFAHYMVDPQQINTGLGLLTKNDRQLLGVVAALGTYLPYGADDLCAQVLTDFGRSSGRGLASNGLVRLGKTPLLVTSHLAREPVRGVSYVPEALWPHLPPLLDALITGTADLPAPTATESRRYSQPKAAGRCRRAHAAHDRADGAAAHTARRRARCWRRSWPGCASGSMTPLNWRDWPQPANCSSDSRVGAHGAAAAAQPGRRASRLFHAVAWQRVERRFPILPVGWGRTFHAWQPGAG